MEVFFKDNLVFIVHNDACSLCAYKSIKKERSASCFEIKYRHEEFLEKSLDWSWNNR